MPAAFQGRICGAGGLQFVSGLFMLGRMTTDPFLHDQPGFRLARGVARMLRSFDHAVLTEFVPARGLRVDLMSLGPRGEIWIVEIKSSIQDMQVDRKWPDYRAYCDRLFFATLPDVPVEIFPAECGFMISDGYSAELLREAPHHPLASASRKALLLRFARSGAQRMLAAELAGIDVSNLPDD